MVKETVKIIIAIGKDSEGHNTDCKIYDKNGNAIGHGQMKLHEDMMSTAYHVELRIKDTVNYIKKEIK